MIRKLRRKSRNPIPKLKREVWKEFSLFIRNRDRWTCITCGKKGKGSFMHAGHFISRVNNSVLFDEKNVHAQCVNCNMWRQGESGIYAQKIIEKYGIKEFDALVARGKEIKHWSEQELNKLLNKYKDGRNNN